jgi:hypothetical protein
MTTYTAISNTLVSVGAKPFASTIQALRDNPIAIGEADSTVPAGLLPTVHLGTINTTSGSTQTITGLSLAPYKFLLAVFNGVTHNDPNNNRAISFAGVQVSNRTNFAENGLIQIDLNTGRGASVVGPSSVGANFNVTNATTSISVTVSVTSFTAGSVRLYGAK